LLLYTALVYSDDILYGAYLLLLTLFHYDDLFFEQIYALSFTELWNVSFDIGLFLASFFTFVRFVIEIYILAKPSMTPPWRLVIRKLLVVASFFMLLLYAFDAFLLDLIYIDDNFNFPGFNLVFNFNITMLYYELTDIVSLISFLVLFPTFISFLFFLKVLPASIFKHHRLYIYAVFCVVYWLLLLDPTFNWNILMQCAKICIVIYFIIEFYVLMMYWK